MNGTISQRELNKSEQLFQRLYDSIRRGELPNGARLATEMELARAHNCSRITVRSSLRQLEELKLIRRVRGDGTYVSSEGIRFSNRRNIAIVALGVHTGPYLETDPYFSQLMRGLFHHGNTLDFSANFITIQNDDRNFMEAFERQNIDLNDYDGLIFAKQLTREEVAALEGGRRNFVALQPPADEELDVSYITIDNFSGIYMATRHLLERGRRNLVFLHGELDSKINWEKLNGFFAALDEYQLTSPIARRHYVITPYEEQDSAETIARLLAEAQTFDALIVHGDWATIGAVNALRAVGLRIPEDVSLVMYNDYAIAPKVLKLPISAIRQPFADQIRCALEILLRQLARPTMNRTIQILQPTLMIRETT